MTLYRVLDPISYVSNNTVVSITKIGAVVDLTDAQAAPLFGKIAYAGSLDELPAARVFYYDTEADFPTFGDEGAIYLDQLTGALYQWAAASATYTQVGGSGGDAIDPTDLGSDIILATVGSAVCEIIGAEQTANKNQPNGYAGLDSTGKVASAQLPSYVDDVLDFANFAAFPSPGESGKIYIADDTELEYRWNAGTSAYIQIVKSPGSTDNVPEGTTNLYFTNARADARVTAAVGTPSTFGKSLLSAPDAPTARADLGVPAVPTGTPTGSKFLRDDNSWATPPSGGGGSNPSPVVAVIGDGSSGPFTVTHSMGTKFVDVTVFKHDTYEQVFVNVTRPTKDTVSINPDEAYATNDYVVLVEYVAQSDVTAPTAATLSLTAHTSTTLSYSWTGATDGVGVVSYSLFKSSDNSLIASGLTGTTYTWSGLTASTSYGAYVKAYDFEGNASVASNTITQTTDAASGDTTPPTAATLVASGTPTTSAVSFSWSGATDNVAVVSYTIFNNADNSIIASGITGTTYTWSGLASGTSYSAYVEAFDAAGNNSPESNVITQSTASSGAANVALVATGAGSRNTSSPTNATDSVVVTSVTEGLLLGFGYISHSANNSDPTTWDSLTVTDTSGDTWSLLYAVSNGSFSSSRLGTLVVMKKSSPSVATHGTTFTPVKAALGTITSIQWVTMFLSGVDSIGTATVINPTTGTNIGQSQTLAAGSIGINAVVVSAALTSISPTADYYAGGSVTGQGDYALLQHAAAPGGGGAVSYAATNSNIIGQILFELKKAP